VQTLEQKWQEFFWSGFYSEAWRGRIDEEGTQKEVEGVLRLLNPLPGSHILDWCGGEGRHSIPLAQKGFEVTLLDFAPNHIEAAREAAKGAGVTLNLIRADFRKTPSSIQADYAVNLFTAGIGYLREEDDIEALQSLHAALKPDALFLLDTMNLFWLVRHYQPSGGYMSEDGSQRTVERREFDFWTNTSKSRMLYWTKDGKESIQQFDHRIYSAAELTSVLRRAGFEPFKLYGDFDGHPFDFETKRLIIVSKRR